MEKNSTEVRMLRLPTCSFCDQAAEYDFSTRTGQWGYGCQQHYLQYRAYSQLGLGLGQKLVLATPEKKDTDKEIK